MSNLQDNITAQSHMRAQRFEAAIECFRNYLAQNPNDVKAILQLGLCHLLNRSEQAFLAIHEQAKKLIAGMNGVPEDVQNLWDKYNQMAKKVTVTALVIGASMVGGCQEDKPSTPAQPVPTEIVKPQPDPDDSYSAHKYSGGVYVPPEIEKTPVEDASPDIERPDVPKDDPEQVPSAHRYSGGVYIPKKSDNE